MLQSVNQTNSKIKKMIESTKSEFLIVGAEKDFLRFYHANFFEGIDNDQVKMRLLTSVSDKVLYIFDDIDRSKVKMMSSEIRDNLCFLIKDNDEIIFFIKNANQTTEQTTAVWTDSEALIYSMKLLFESIWLKSKNIHL